MIVGLTVGESHDGEDHAKASYHGEGRDGAIMPESSSMKTAMSESLHEGEHHAG